MSPALDPIRRALTMKRVGYAIGAVIFVIAGLAVWLPLEVDAVRRQINIAPPPDGAVWIIRGLAFLFFGAAVIFGLLVARTPPALRSPLWQLLTRFPEDVVWVHDNMVVEHRVEGIKVNTTRYLFFLTVDPKRNQSLEFRERVAAEVLAELPALLPKAVFGYSEARMARYLKDPRGFAAAERALPNATRP